MRRPNIVIIKTDQQRFDTINALGFSHMITPNLDRLKKEGITFTQAHCCGATCVASRAAFYTGMHANNTGVYHFNKWTHLRTWLHDLRDNGYYLSGIGKVHFNPDESWKGPFHERIIAENFPTWEPWDDYSNHLRNHRQPHPLKRLTSDGQWGNKCASDVFPLDECFHVDRFVGSKAVNWIHQYEKPKPFLLHVGFVGPHDPFDPPARWHAQYADKEVPGPIYSGDDFEQRPPEYKRFMERFHSDTNQYSKPPQYGAGHMNLSEKTDKEIIRWRKHYYAKISFIDEQIGKLLDAIESRGLAQNTIVLFTSDHGENLGDHQLIYKWLLTEEVTHIPMIIRLPNGIRAGACDHRLFSHIDIGPTLLDMTETPIPSYLDGRSNRKRIQEGSSENIPSRVYCRDNYMTMIRTDSKRLIHYAGQAYGEYYDMEIDPHQFKNLFTSPSHQHEIKNLIYEFMNEQINSDYKGSMQRVARHKGENRKWPQLNPHDPFCLMGQPNEIKKTETIIN